MTPIEQLLDAVAKRRRYGPPLSEADEATIEDLVTVLVPTHSDEPWL